jgi:AraC-like DNA-binding protein
VEVVAFLPRPLLSHLGVVLRSRHTLTPVASWSELQSVVRQDCSDVVVADPRANGDVDVQMLEDIRQRYPSLSIVLYTQLAPASMQAAVRLAKSGVEHVVLSRFDDEPGRFLELLESMPSHGLGERMLKELGGSLAKLPPTVARTIDRLFRSPGNFKNAEAVAAASNMNLRTLYRNLEAAGLFSPWTLIVSARLLRAFGLLQDPGRSIKDVAAIAGYHSPWQLSQQFRAITGRTTTQVRRDLTGEALVSLLAERVRQRRSA